MIHLDVLLLIRVVVSILLITICLIETQNQQENVVIQVNVYANQKYVQNALSIRIAKVVPIQHVHHVQRIDQPQILQQGKHLLKLVYLYQQ